MAAISSETRCDSPARKCAAIDHHVDLIRAVARGAADFFELHAQRHWPLGKPVATEATFTPVSPRNFFAARTRFG